MSVMIKLSREGRNNLPFFRVQVIDKQFSPKSGKTLEYIGTYSPVGKTEKFEVKQDRLKFWIDRGALVSARIQKLLKKLAKSAK